MEESAVEQDEESESEGYEIDSDDMKTAQAMDWEACLNSI